MSKSPDAPGVLDKVTLLPEWERGSRMPGAHGKTLPLCLSTSTSSPLTICLQTSLNSLCWDQCFHWSHEAQDSLLVPHLYTLIIIWLMSREATNPLPKLPGTLLPLSLPWFSSQHLAASEKPHLYLSHYFSPGGHTVGKDLPVFHTVVDQTLKRVHSKS